MMECKDLKNSFDQYSLYVHGYLLPWLDEQRQNGLLKQGKKTKALSYFFRKNFNQRTTNRIRRRDR